MNLRRVAVVLATFGAVAAAGMSSASAATVESASSTMNHHDWCFAQQWQAGDSHWRQCDDVSGWWNHDRHDNSRFDNNHHDNNWQSGPDRRR